MMSQSNIFNFPRMPLQAFRQNERFRNSSFEPLLELKKMFEELSQIVDQKINNYLAKSQEIDIRQLQQLQAIQCVISKMDGQIQDIIEKVDQSECIANVINQDVQKLVQIKPQKLNNEQDQIEKNLIELEKDSKATLKLINQIDCQLKKVEQKTSILEEKQIFFQGTIMKIANQNVLENHHKYDQIIDKVDEVKKSLSKRIARSGGK